MLGEGVDPPDSLLQLKEAIYERDNAKITENLYMLLIDQQLNYDMNAEDKLVPTKLDFSKKEDATVFQKINYVYSYGINMLKRGMIDREPLTRIVEEKIAKKVGMDGKALDEWLSMP